MSRTLLLLLLFISNLTHADACSSVGYCGVHPNLPVFGPGPVTNLGEPNNGTAVTNAASHVGWAIAIPALGYMIDGNKGKWVAGVSWIAFTLLDEAFLHSPASPARSYPSEVRTDLITRIAPTILVLTF